MVKTDSGLDFDKKKYEMLADEVLFLRKSKAEFVLTNLKAFGPSSFIIIKNKML